MGTTRGNGEGNGQTRLFLSHKISNSAGVGFLFSAHFNLRSVELQNVMDGHILMVSRMFLLLLGGGF